MALTRLPRWVVAAAMAALLLAGLALDGLVGAALLLLLGVFLGWLLVLSWPVLSTPARAVRLVVLTCLVVAAAFQAGLVAL